MLFDYLIMAMSIFVQKVFLPRLVAVSVFDFSGNRFLHFDGDLQFGESWGFSGGNAENTELPNL